MIPRYAEDGQVCEVGLERSPYTPEEIVLYSTLSREENVVVQLYSAVIDCSSKKSRANDFAAVIRWKGRKCKVVKPLSPR
jgi:hypothetical protein